MEAWVKRLNERWRATGWTKVELAKRAEVDKESVYKYLRGGVKQPRGEIPEKLADALGVSRLWLFDGIGPQYSRLPLVGYVSAGESVVTYDDHAPGGGYDTVDFDMDAADPIAIEVRGGSMAPVYRSGDVLLCSRSRGADIDLCVGQDCVIRTAEDEGFLKVLSRGSRAGLYTLESYNRAFDPIVDVRLRWVAPVIWVRRGRLGRSAA